MKALLAGGQCWTDGGSAQTTSAGVILTAPVTAHVKGAYTTMVASTAFNSDGILVHAMCGAGGGTSWAFVDVAIGATTAEQDIIPNLFVAQGQAAPKSFYFPIPIPAGTRISARYQGNISGSAPLDVTVYPVTGDFYLNHAQRVVSWGATLATTRGTTIDGGVTANAKGAYVQLSASTECDVSEIIIATGGTGTAAAAGAHFLVDLAIGAGGSEQIILPNLWFRVGSASSGFSPLPEVVGPLPVAIPAGSRVSARCQSSSNVAGDRTLDLVVHGIA